MMGIQAMSPQHRQAVSEAARRTWADPDHRAARIAAMRLVAPDEVSAIVAAAAAEPRRLYKLIAREFGVSESTVNAVARAHGIRRKPLRIKPRISLTPPPAAWRGAH
jgi:hypothetical protein